MSSIKAQIDTVSSDVLIEVHDQQFRKDYYRASFNLQLIDKYVCKAKRVETFSPTVSFCDYLSRSIGLIDLNDERDVESLKL